MSQPLFWMLTGCALFAIGLYGLAVRSHLLHRILALNVMGTGCFMVLVATAARSSPPDPVPHAMVLTGIVVAVSATAFALALLLRLHAVTGRTGLDGPDGRRGGDS